MTRQIAKLVCFIASDDSPKYTCTRNHSKGNLPPKMEIQVPKDPTWKDGKEQICKCIECYPQLQHSPNPLVKCG